LWTKALGASKVTATANKTSVGGHKGHLDRDCSQPGKGL